jgi:hypothetical protein
VTVTVWQIVVTPQPCASELALGKAVVRRAMLLAEVGMIVKLRTYRHCAKGKLKTLRLVAQCIQILP